MPTSIDSKCYKNWQLVFIEKIYYRVSEDACGLIAWSAGQKDAAIYPAIDSDFADAEKPCNLIGPEEGLLREILHLHHKVVHALLPFLMISCASSQG